MFGWLASTGIAWLAAQGAPAAPAAALIDDPAALAAAIDTTIEADLAAAGLTPAEPIEEALWLRRLSLDVRGVVPTGAEVAAFLADSDPGKRAVRIDAWLSSPEFAEHMASLWANLLCEGTTAKEGEQGRMWLEPWLRSQFAGDAALGPIVRELIAATNESNTPGPAAFPLLYRDTIDTLSGLSARHFLGLQIQCSQCHDDPSDRFTQQQFNQFTAFFADLSVDSLRGQSKMGRLFRVRDLPPEKQLREELRRLAGASGTKSASAPSSGGGAMRGGAMANGAMQPAAGAPVQAAGAVGDAVAPAIPSLAELTALLDAPDHGVAWAAEHLQDKPFAEALLAALPAAASDELQRCIDVAAWRVAGHLDHQPYADQPGRSRRLALAEWIVAPSNPWFGRNMANRIWAHFLGQGLHEPVDDLMATDDRVLPGLLAQLAREFHAGGTSVRKLAAAILRTRTYARGPSRAESPRGRRADERRFAAHPLRSLTAEQALATMVQLRPEMARSEQGSRRAAYSPLDRKAYELKRYFGQLGGAGRGGADASILQSLFLMNNSLARPAQSLRESPAAAQFRDGARPLAERLAGLWLELLGRLPTAAEVEAIGATLAAGNDALQDPDEQLDALFWALVNSAEFHTNR